MSIMTGNGTASNFSGGGTMFTADNLSAQEKLQHQVYFSSDDNITNAYDVESDGIASGNWTTSTSGVTTADLNPSTKYYINKAS